MKNVETMQIEDKSTGKLYPVTSDLKQVISDNIIRLVHGGRVSGVELDGKPKKLGLDNKMRLTLTPDAGLFQTRRSGLATIDVVDSEVAYFLSDNLNQLIVEKIDELLEGEKVGPLLFEGVNEFYLSLTDYSQLVLTRTE